MSVFSMHILTFYIPATHFSKMAVPTYLITIYMDSKTNSVALLKVIPGVTIT